MNNTNDDGEMPSWLKEIYELRDQVKSDQDGVIINVRYEYFIEWSRINTWGKLAGWVEHLTDKNWWTKKHTCCLISEVANHFGWEVDR